MAVQKKKKIKKKNSENSNNLEVFKWTPQRKKAALLLSDGTKTYEEVAEEVRIHISTLWNWRHCSAFLEEVDRLTLLNENFTRAGLLKHMLKGLKIKKSYISEDKNTFLDYIKAISDIQELTKQKVEHSGKIDGTINVNIRSPEEIEQEILDKLTRIRSKRDSE